MSQGSWKAQEGTDWALLWGLYGWPWRPSDLHSLPEKGRTGHINLGHTPLSPTQGLLQAPHLAHIFMLSTPKKLNLLLFI